MWPRSCARAARCTCSPDRAGGVPARIGARLGVKPGAELLAAIEAARAAGIPIELIDRDIDITFYRTWRNLGCRRA